MLFLFVHVFSCSLSKFFYSCMKINGWQLSSDVMPCEWHCKPIKGDWNGSGMHANFSNTTLRTAGSKETYEKILNGFAPKDVIAAHIAVYGHDNHLRLTGKHETQSIDKFSYGISDRGASIRIPIAAVEKGWKGWLEDRRPNSAADPYKVAARIVKTVKMAKV